MNVELSEAEIMDLEMGVRTASQHFGPGDPTYKRLRRLWEKLLAAKFHVPLEDAVRALPEVPGIVVFDFDAVED